MTVSYSVYTPTDTTGATVNYVPCQHCGEICYADPCEQRCAKSRELRDYILSAQIDFDERNGYPPIAARSFDDLRARLGLQ